MATLRCPNEHAAVIRNDPEGMGLRAECDVCGWTAAHGIAGEPSEAERGALPKEHNGSRRLGRGK